MDPCISVENVSLNLRSQAGEVNVLREINMTVGKGESVAIVGASGSGKTSTLLVVAGLEKASSGRITIDGEPVTDWTEDQLAILRREKFGIVFQAFHLVPTMTALENVMIPLELQNHDQAKADALEMLDKVGLGHRASHYPAQLSGGEQQRVALARAFVTKPKIIMADEPTGNLDQDNGHKIMDLLFDLQQQHGSTLVLITHDPTLADRCQRTLTMQDGCFVR